jgi:hypothetical protein
MAALAERIAQRRQWRALPGSQSEFLRLPHFEALYSGERGAGKTDALLMSFAQHVGKGWGRAWRGILLRAEATQLKDVIEKAATWFPAVWPDSQLIAGGEPEYRWATGERLLFRHARTVNDYHKYHGHAYPFIALEEATSGWAFPDVYLRMMSLCRSSVPGMPRMVRVTTNPHGPGHGWVKARFIDPAPMGETIRDPDTGLTRVAIHAKLEENRVLLAADPDYLRRVIASTNGDEMLLKAWTEGSWDIVAGGIFAGRWDKDASVLEPFKVPRSWPVYRAFDWGSSKPYAVGWFAIADGSPVNGRHFHRGSAVMISELYGWNGKPNEGINETNRQIAERIKAAEAGIAATLLSGQTIYAGPADSAIYEVRNGDSIGAEIERFGVSFVPADKGPGSRVAGWQKLGGMMLAARKTPMEEAGFFVFSTCRQWLRTVPNLARDLKHSDDVDTDQEDHCFTAETSITTRYTRGNRLTVGDLVGQSGETVGADGCWHAFRDVRLTRRSARVVRVVFADGWSFRCTPDHRFMLKTGEWCRADQLTGKSCLAWSLNRPRFSNSVAGGTTCAGDTSSGAASACTGSSTSPAMGPSPRGITSITSTAIRRTTSPGTWSASRTATTCATTSPSARPNSGWHSLLPAKLLRRAGIAARTVWRGIVAISRQLPSLRGIGLPRVSALSAVGHSPAGRRTPASSGSAPTPASRPHVAPLGSTTRPGPAQHAAPSSWLTATRPDQPADRPARSSCAVVAVLEAGVADVYCMTVDEGASFALGNGVVVHNCGDLTRYMVNRESQTGLGAVHLPRGR